MFQKEMAMLSLIPGWYRRSKSWSTPIPLPLGAFLLTMSWTRLQELIDNRPFLKIARQDCLDDHVHVGKKCQLPRW